MTRKTNEEKPRRQCAKCPWRVDADPNDIPNGYCSTKHRGLTITIADPGSLRGMGGTLRSMACHESNVQGKEKHCVGWLMNQLGEGNNIPLRMAVARGQIDANVELVGEQHATLEDTFPEG